MGRLLLIALLLQGPAPSQYVFVGFNKGASGPAAPTVLQTCGGSGSAGSAACAFGSNVTSGSRLYFAGEDFSGNATSLAGSGAGCPSSSTFTTDNDSSNFIISSSMDGTSAGGACTVTYTGTGNITLYGIEIAGSSGGIDVRGAPVCQNGCAVINTGTAFNCPAITTTASNDLVICAAWDTGGNGATNTYTAGSGFTLQVGGTANNFGTGIETKAQAASGAITPTYASYSVTTTLETASIAYKP